MENITSKWTNPINKNWYQDSTNISFSAPIFQGKEDCDTLIIGGGLAGLSLKSMLAEERICTILLEEKKIALGASGLNGGFCSPGWSVDQLELEKRIGYECANHLYAVSMSGFHWMENLCKKVKPEISQKKNGLLKAYPSKRYEVLLNEIERFNDKYGANIQFLKGRDFLHHLKSSRYYCGCLDWQSFHFNPLNVIRSLAINLQRKAGKIFEGTKVIDVKRSKVGYRIKTSTGGIVNSRRVVFATGGYFSKVGGSNLERKLFSLQTTIGVTEPLNGHLSETISPTVAIHDNRRAGNYFRMLPDGRLLWGRDIRAIGEPTEQQIIRGTKKDLKFFFPEKRKFFDDIAIDYAWSGKLGYSSNFMPYLLAVKPDLYFMTGFGGHGMNAAPAAANIVREAILGNHLNMKMFGEFSPRWNFALFGRCVAEAYLRCLKIRDYIESI